MGGRHEFLWRGHQILAVASGITWYIYSVEDIFGGPEVIPGEPWADTEERILSWLDANPIFPTEQ